MSDTLEKIQRLIRQGDLKISEHGYDELADEGIRVKEVVPVRRMRFWSKIIPILPRDRPYWSYKRTNEEIRST